MSTQINNLNLIYESPDLLETRSAEYSQSCSINYLRGIGKYQSLPSIFHLENGTRNLPNFSTSKSTFYWEKGKNNYNHLKKLVYLMSLAKICVSLGAAAPPSPDL